MQNTFFTDWVGPFPDVLWEPAFLSEQEHQRLLRYCLDEVSWAQKQVYYGGRTIDVPRELAWFGDVDYAYSGVRHKALPMPKPLDGLARSIEAWLLDKHGIKERFNSVLLNHYRSGDDAIGMHSDDESQLHPQPVIASVSLGAARTFIFEHKASSLRHKNQLPGGSLLVMKGTCQQQWRHGIPREPAAGPRVNLTFRHTDAPPTR